MTENHEKNVPEINPSTLRKSVIIDAVRSPIGVPGGIMAGIRPDGLLSQVLLGLLTRNQALSVEQVELLTVGCAAPEGPQGRLVARAAGLLAGLPAGTVGNVVSCDCGSSAEAIHQADIAIRAGDNDVVIAGGIEDMIAVPPGGFNPSFHPSLAARNYYISTGEAAETTAAEAQIERRVQEEFAIASHNKSLAAWDNGHFDNEVIPVQYSGKMIVRDEGPNKPNVEQIKRLDPIFLENGTVTAATSGSAAIGAAAVLLAEPAVAESIGLKPRARIIARAACGGDWERPVLAALAAAEKALDKAGLSLKDLQAIEMHEGFAAEVLYAIETAKWPVGKINQNGGALALGHPTGAAGARMMTTLINTLEQLKGRYGMMVIGAGSGQGFATIIECLNGAAGNE